MACDYQPALLVIDPHPNALRGWLTKPTRDATVIVARQQIASRHLVEQPAALRGLTGLVVEGRRLVQLPVDGPAHALEVALLGLRRWLVTGEHVATVLVEGPGGMPPHPAALERIAAHGLEGAVALDPFPWVTDTSIWIAGRDRLVSAPLPSGRTDKARALADLLSELSPPERDPMANLLRALRGDLDTWLEQGADLLRATYVERCVSAVRRGQTTRWQGAAAL
jgi:hypothetical protein